MQEVCGCGAEPLDGRPVEDADRLRHVFLGIAADAGIEEISERDLILAVFVDIGDPQLRFPHECVVGPLKTCRCSAIESSTVSRKEPL